MANPTKKTANKAAPATPASPTKASHTDKIGPIQETDTIPPATRGDSPYRKAVNEVEAGQNRVFPKAARNCVLKYAKEARFEYETRTNSDGETFTFYRTK